MLHHHVSGYSDPTQHLEVHQVEKHDGPSQPVDLQSVYSYIDLGALIWHGQAAGEIKIHSYTTMIQVPVFL